MGVAGSLPGKGALPGPLVAQWVAREDNTLIRLPDAWAFSDGKGCKGGGKEWQGGQGRWGLGNLFKTITVRDIFTSKVQQ